MRTVTKDISFCEFFSIRAGQTCMNNYGPTHNKQQTTNNRPRQATNNKHQQTIGNEHPTTNNHKHQITGNSGANDKWDRAELGRWMSLNTSDVKQWRERMWMMSTHYEHVMSPSWFKLLSITCFQRASYSPSSSPFTADPFAKRRSAKRRFATRRIAKRRFAKRRFAKTPILKTPIRKTRIRKTTIRKKHSATWNHITNFRNRTLSD